MTGGTHRAEGARGYQRNSVQAGALLSLFINVGAALTARRTGAVAMAVPGCSSFSKAAFITALQYVSRDRGITILM